MWHSVISCLLAGAMMWIPGLVRRDEHLDADRAGRAVLLGAGMLFPLATTGAMEPFPYLAGAAGALVGGMQNMGSGLATWLSAMLPQTGQFSLGLLMFAMALLILLCWWPLSNRMQHQGHTA
jgi:hypothetical protein